MEISFLRFGSLLVIISVALDSLRHFGAKFAYDYLDESWISVNSRLGCKTPRRRELLFGCLVLGSIRR